jgi:hypothetical protein
MTRQPWSSSQRRGTILILVAGMCALLASLTIAFMIKVRSGSDSTSVVAQETQARLMLHAACCYILEAGRMGYGPSRVAALQPATAGQGIVSDPSGNLEVREGYGWIDVRSADLESPQGDYGPFDQNRTSVVTHKGTWPDVGGIVICPMFRWSRPPYAIKATVAYNPILIDPSQASDPRYGRPLLLNPDPQPAVVNGWPSGVSDSLMTPAGVPNWTDYVTGSPQPMSSSQGSAWFRVFRKSQATFIITCGAGGTMGYRDWNEVQAASTAVTGAPGGASGPALFNNDRDFFESLLSVEVRLWYEVRWSGGVRPLDFRFEEPKWWWQLQNGMAYRTYPVNASQYPGWCRANKFNPNPLGTISYIQRLDAQGGQPIDPVSGAIAVW